ncbi:MAG: RNA polymerase sigma-70 factor [Reichenbachiella sp.]
MRKNRDIKLNEQPLVSKDRLIEHERLFKTYYKPLLVFAIRWLHDRQDAEDVVQEVFTKIWKKGAEISETINIQSYLFGAVKNGCMNHDRHLKVMQRHQNDSKYSLPINENPHHYMMLNEIEKRIEDTLKSLPQKSKNVFILSRYEQKRNKEIADIMNISIKTVEAHMSKVLSALKRNLKHYISVILIIVLDLLK